MLKYISKYKKKEDDLMFYVLFALSLFLLLFLSIYLTKNDENGEKLDIIIKYSTIVFCILTFLNVFLPDGFTISREPDTLNNMNEEFQAILRWLNYACFTVLPIAVFQKNKYFVKLAYYLCLPVALLNVAYYNKYIEYFTSREGAGLRTVKILSENFKEFLLNETFRAIFFGAVCLAQLVSLILLAYRKFGEMRFEKKERKNFILIGLGVLYMSLPVFVPQYLLGHVDIMVKRFSLPHIIWIVGIAVIIVALYFLFRNKSYETRYLLVLSMSYALLMQFSEMFSASAELNVMKLPLQLCNLGSYLALLMLLSKNEKFYHFALIVNVVGAVIAIIILDIGQDVSHLSRLWVVHYIVEHTKVLVVPILCLVLKVFNPLTKKSLKHFSVGFTAYYVFVFVLGTISNGFYRIFADKPFQNFFYSNHMFMFDKDIARGLVGFTDPLFENLVIKIGAFEIYPLVQSLVYVAFMVICIGVFFLIYALTAKQRKEYIEKNN